MFALKDESGQKMYNNPSQLFAFADSAIHISTEVTPVKLYAYSEEKTGNQLQNRSASNKKSAEKILNYTSSASDGTQDLLSPLTLNFAVPLKRF